MKIVLSPGEVITIEYERADGEVIVRFDEDATTVTVDGQLVHRDLFVFFEDEEGIESPGDKNG